MNSTVHCLPFDLEVQAFATHSGLSRCSATAQGIWLEFLEEAFCTGSLHLRGLDAVAARLGIDKAALFPHLDQLVTRRVFGVTRNGQMRPINADYLCVDFWRRLQEHAA